MWQLIFYYNLRKVLKGSKKKIEIIFYKIFFQLPIVKSIKRFIFNKDRQFNTTYWIKLFWKGYLWQNQTKVLFCFKTITKTW